VFLFAINSGQAVAALWGALRAGHAIALLNPEAPDAVRQNLIERYNPDWVMMPGASRQPAGYAPIAGAPTHAWHTRISSSDDPIHENTDVLLATSGSTGSPKFVRLSQASLGANAEAIARVLDIRSEDRAVGHLPLHYSFGLSVVTSHLTRGARVVFTPGTFTSKEFWAHVRAEACTSLPGVPYHYELLRRLDLNRLDGGAVKTLTQAGGRLAPELVRHFAEIAAARGGRFFVMYGQTEAAPRISTLPAEEAAAFPGSVGRALPSGRLEVVDSEAKPLSPEEVGEVVYHGPNVMQGYAHCRDDLASGDVVGGRLATGDLGYLDETGRLFITGRAARIAKIFGVRVNLDDVERQVEGPWPRAAIDFEGKVAVALERADADACRAVAKNLSNWLAVHHSAVIVRSVATLPLNANGKVDYKAIEEHVR